MLQLKYQDFQGRQLSPKNAKMAYKLLRNKHVTNKILRQA